MKKLLFLIAGFFASAFFWDGSKINFMSNDLSAARFKAAQDGKMIVVQFGARWCLPCNVMYEGAWQNEEVVAFTNQNFVAVKMDIDQVDAMKTRDRFNVEAIPATLILNSKGEEIKRFEGSMGAESLLGFLQTYSAPEHRSKINAAPDREIVPEIALAEAEKPAEDQVLTPTTEPEKALAAPPTEPAISKNDEPEAEISVDEPEKKGLLNQAPPRRRPETESSVSALRPAARPKAFDEEKKAAPRAEPKKETPPVAYSAPKTAPKKFEKSTESAPKTARRSGYTTQIGVFATPGQAEKLAAELSKRFGKRAFLAETIFNGKRMMRAMLGEFSSREEAAAFKLRLKNSGQDAFVKNWADVR